MYSVWSLTILQAQSEYEEYSYSVKIINPNDKGGYQFEQLQTKYPELTSLEQIRSELSNLRHSLMVQAVNLAIFFQAMG